MHPLKNAETVAGAPLLAGVRVVGAGSAAVMMAGVAGQAVAKIAGKGPGPSPLRPRELGYLAATADRLLLLVFKQGMVTSTATAIFAAADRQYLAGIDISKSLSMNPVVVRFTTGEEWHFQCDKMGLRHAKELVEAIIPTDAEP